MGKINDMLTIRVVSLNDQENKYPLFSSAMISITQCSKLKSSRLNNYDNCKRERIYKFDQLMWANLFEKIIIFNLLVAWRFAMIVLI
ncbi:hypothetical protein RhiirA5_352435 [Rhizophagus irregularis]|uniref:Uncharacterized protein n=2 Tax=Rhizophagus irregularis TaxID=588596 RepID=A0A2I1EL13_9GLOM|nr:hypothetical protein RhiirA5_352435 [Rhizophagus irregularis]PKY22809.1 hypothetical protein RhiirB3_411056 [Rhizophagus irregularis]